VVLIRFRCHGALGIRLQIRLALFGLLVLRVALCFGRRQVDGGQHEERARSERSNPRKKRWRRTRGGRRTRSPSELHPCSRRDWSRRRDGARRFDEHGAPWFAWRSWARATAAVTAPAGEEAAQSIATRTRAIEVSSSPGRADRSRPSFVPTKSQSGPPLLRLLALTPALRARSFDLRVHRAHAPHRAPTRRNLDAARRVAAGARTLEAPKTGPSEMIELARKPVRLTAKLRAGRASNARSDRGARAERAEATRGPSPPGSSDVCLGASGSPPGAHEIGNPIAAMLRARGPASPR